ncbi:hypothetical protein KC19_4G227600 [Ceratodon purpureus]|uniref:Uncharacterized protein n=1 Tax=Ceratodon purpureus TaxID=3225 RepID=A0A8T0IF50_CERPU|nr:hypothetical protein KC19_4G227600 [Ceratodon purpureus]
MNRTHTTCAQQFSQSWSLACKSSILMVDHVHDQLLNDVTSTHEFCQSFSGYNISTKMPLETNILHVDSKSRSVQGMKIGSTTVGGKSVRVSKHNLRVVISSKRPCDRQ